eukprot:gene13681-13797_t
MSLSTAFQVAQSAMSVVSNQSTVVSGNIAGVNDPNYVRRVANVTTDANGTATMAAITRITDQNLYDTMLATTSSSNAAGAITSGLNQLQNTVGDTSSTQSPAALVGTLSNDLQAYVSAPDNMTQAQGVVTDAQTVATALNSASTLVQTVRQQADSSMAQAVTAINADLVKFQQANSTIVGGSSSNEAVNHAMDVRDGILKDLSQYMGISTLQQPNGGTVIYTDSGVTLFETTPRSVAFATTTPLAAGVSGASVIVDGVPVTGSGSTMPLKSGSLAGLAQLRDTIAPTYQSQLDSIASGLLSAFAETGATPTSLPAQAGLFNWSGGPSMPTVTTGLAASISVNAAVDPAQGGSLTTLRDGGIAGASYNTNTTGAASYSTHLQSLVTAMGAAQSFSAATGLGTSMTVTNYATASVGWLEAQRQAATNNSDYQTTLQTSATQALSNTSGVNIDTEMTKMLSLENSYQASAKLMSAIDSMFTNLMDIHA